MTEKVEGSMRRFWRNLCGDFEVKCEILGHSVREEMKNSMRRLWGDFCGDFEVKM